MSPNAKPRIYISYNPDAGTRTPMWIIHRPPQPEPVHPGILGDDLTWME